MSTLISVLEPGDIIYTRNFRGDEIIIWAVAMDGTLTRKVDKKKQDGQ